MDRDLQRQFESVAREGQSACEELERGQAEKPLAGHFVSILEDAAEAPFALTVVGSDPQARSRVVSWLYGGEHGLLALQVPDQVGLVEIHLQDRGFLLQRSGAEAAEFDRMEAFLEALESQDLARRGDEGGFVDSLTLRLETPDGRDGLRGLHILMPENVRAMGRFPGVLTRITSASNLVLLAGPPELEIDDRDRALLEDLTAAVEAVWPVVIGPEGDLPRDGWWRDRELLRAPHRMEPLVLDAGDGRPVVPALLASPDDERRRALFATHHARRFQHAVAAVAERHEHELRRLRSRKSRERRRNEALRSSGGAGRLRDVSSRLKRRVQEEFDTLARAIQERSRAALLPEGDVSRLIQENLASLDADDLRQEEAHDAIKLSVDEALLDHVSRSLKKELKKGLREDLLLLRDGLQAFRDEIEAEVEEITNSSFNVDLQPPDEREVWGAMKEMLSVDVRYRGEMAKRSFVERLGEGRRAVFMILMSLSIVGSIVGVNLRQARWIGGVFLVVFLGAFFRTFKNWKRQDRAKLEKEADRVRDTLDSEARRLAQDIQREKETRLRDHLDRLRKVLVREVEEALKEYERRSAADADRQRAEAKEREAAVDRKIRDREQVGRRLDALAGSVRELDRACRDRLRDAFRAARAAPADAGS